MHKYEHHFNMLASQNSSTYNTLRLQPDINTECMLARKIQGGHSPDMIKFPDFSGYFK